MRERRKSGHGCLALLALGAILGGCSASELLPSMPSLTTSSADAPKMRVTPPIAMVTLKPVIGAPQAFQQTLARQLNEAATRENIALIVDSSIATPHTVSGFIVLNNGVKGARVTHVWDMLNANGERISRITGEEAIVATTGTQDPWASVPPAVVKTIAEKVITQIAADLKTPQVAQQVTR